MLKHESSLSEVFALTLSQLKLVKEWVLFVSKNDRAINAYKVSICFPASSLLLLNYLCAEFHLLMSNRKCTSTRSAQSQYWTTKLWLPAYQVHPKLRKAHYSLLFFYPQSERSAKYIHSQRLQGFISSKPRLSIKTEGTVWTFVFLSPVNSK